MERTVNLCVSVTDIRTVTSPQGDVSVNQGGGDPHVTEVNNGKFLKKYIHLLPKMT